MQTWFLFRDIDQSARTLDRQRLGAQIYEGIHILSSLVQANQELVTPKRSVINHPVSQMWVGHEWGLLLYIKSHIQEWVRRGYHSDINQRNFLFLEGVVHAAPRGRTWPDIPDELIQEHRRKVLERLPDWYQPRLS